MIRKSTTTITKARMLPTGKDPTGLNHGPLSITRRTGMETMDTTHAKGKNTTRMGDRTHLITTKRMTTCGDSTVQACATACYLPSFMHI